MKGDRISILFFSRGRGRGHAVPDLAIVDELAQFDAKLYIQFVSYATGAETLCKSKFPVIDLRLPETNGFLSMFFLAHKIIGDNRPDIVISHEEFGVMPAAKFAGVPTIFLGDWFPRAGHVSAEAISCAESIVFLEHDGIFPHPDAMGARPLFVGPIVRKMKYTLNDRSRARAELALPQDALVISVMPGAWATEERAPIADLVFPAFCSLKRRNKILFWLSSRDGVFLRHKSAGLQNVTIVEDCENVERVMVASDVLITKGNRGTIMEAASLGVPSVSLSHAMNAIDDTLVSRIRSNTALNAKTASGESLARCIEHLASIPVSQREKPLELHLRGGTIAARALAEEIYRLLSDKKCDVVLGI